MNESLITVLTERGQTSVPAALRKSGRLKPGSRLKWHQISETEFHVQAIDEKKPRGARAMIGFARQFNPSDHRGTDEILAEIRAGEADR